MPSSNASIIRDFWNSGIKLVIMSILCLVVKLDQTSIAQESFPNEPLQGLDTSFPRPVPFKVMLGIERVYLLAFPFSFPQDPQVFLRSYCLF